MSKTKIQLAAVAFAILATAGMAQAGRDGSTAKITNAVATGSVDAIVAEIERAEHLVCQNCADIMTALLDHDRYEVRQAAAWWFAKRPSVKDVYVAQMTEDLASTSSRAVRNAADFLGTVKAYGSIPALTTAFQSGVDVEARRHIIRGVGRMANQAGNGLLVLGMADADATVRTEAVKWYRDVLGQTDAAPMFGLLGDADATVRANAATSIGGLRGAGARAQLEQLVVNDPSADVRRNAAWALGRIGDRASRDALEQAKNDASGLVRRTAAAALGQLR
jgi:HEAT repeat protein